MPTLPIARPVLFPLWAVLGNRCGCGDGAACTRIGKHPRVRWGDIIHPGYTILGDTNYAVKTGASPGGSGVFVVDADNEAAMTWFEKKNGGAPDTFTVRTARGAHYYYQLPPDGRAVRRSISELAPKIDIVGEKWWVVGPGSTHKSGARYAVLRDAPIAPCPAWLLRWERLYARPVGPMVEYPGDVTTEPELSYRRAKYVEFCREAPPSIQEKAGDQALWRVVQYGAFDLRLPNDVLLAVLTEHFDPRCQPPWGDALAERVRHKAHSAKTQSARRAREPLSYKVASKVGRLPAALTPPAPATPTPAAWTPPEPRGPKPAPWKKPRRRAKGAT